MAYDHRWRTIWLIALAWGLASTAQVGAVTVPAAPASSDAAHPHATRHWVESRLYFGLGRLESSGLAARERQWQEFLDHVVTPRFPAGLSVQDVYGQWQGPEQPRPIRLRSKVLIIDYPDTPANRGRIEQIRLLWKAKTGDRSVLRVTVPADVSF